MTEVVELRTLRIGSTGEEVIELQSTLSILKYTPGVTDGIFGVTTASAVIQFQKYNGFVPDGIVGPITWGYIQSLIATYKIYIIKPGDTFYKIALANNISLSGLIATNPEINPQMLRIGQAIQLYPVNLTDPSIRITYPKDGAILPYSDLDITWTAAPGASGYTVIVSDMDNPLPYLRDYTNSVPADTLNFRLTTDHIISGHHYAITVQINKPVYTAVGYIDPGYMQKVNVTIGESTVKALNIKSPVQNATIAQGTPVILLWDAPGDANALNTEIFITSNNGNTSYNAPNGTEIRQYLLTPGKHHIRVELGSGDRVIYQGSTDITIQ